MLFLGGFLVLVKVVKTHCEVMYFKSHRGGLLIWTNFATLESDVEDMILYLKRGTCLIQGE